MNIINPIFESILDNEPFIKSLLTTYGIVKNYQRDRKIELHNKELQYIKNVLGLTSYELTENQVKIIDIFLAKSEQYSMNLNWITITYDEIQEKLNMDKSEFQNIVLELESESFINKNVFTDNSMEYKLNYEIFTKSDLMYKLFNRSIGYYEIFNMVIDLLLQIESDSDIDVNKFMQQNSLNYLFINPTIYHLNKLDIIEYYSSRTPDILLDKHFYLKDKAKLLKLKKQLLLENR